MILDRIFVPKDNVERTCESFEVALGESRHPKFVMRDKARAWFRKLERRLALLAVIGCTQVDACQERLMTDRVDFVDVGIVDKKLDLRFGADARDD